MNFDIFAKLSDLYNFLSVWNSALYCTIGSAFRRCSCRWLRSVVRLLILSIQIKRLNKEKNKESN